MSDKATILKEIIHHFASNDIDRDWAHADDMSSYGLDHRSEDGTKFWLDINEDGTIVVLWKPLGAVEPTVLRFT